MSAIVKIEYTNVVGEFRTFTVKPHFMWFGKTVMYPEEQWFLKAIDMKANVEHDFAMANIRSWTPTDMEPLSGDQLWEMLRPKISDVMAHNASVEFGGTEPVAKGDWDSYVQVIPDYVPVYNRLPSKVDLRESPAFEESMRNGQLVCDVANGLPDSEHE